MVCNAFADALKRRKAPSIIHSDQGAEYLSGKHLNLCKVYGVSASASGPGQSWQNGFMERFFNTFKEELTEALVYLHNIEELYERIASWIYYYNHERIHTILLMPPAEYAKQLQPTSQAQASLGMDRVSRKNGSLTIRHYSEHKSAIEENYGSVDNLMEVFRCNS